MNRLARIGLIIAGILAVLLLVAVVAAIVIVRRPFPQTEGTITLQGLQDEVQIYRDEFGIPHIYAQNEADLFFAQGYTHAQDRFWQMEFQRHVGRGRLSEIAGASTVDIDTFIRTFGWNRMAEDTVSYYESEAPEFLTVLDAYSAGVNAYIDAHRNELSLHFTVLGAVQQPWEIEPWTPVDTVAWGVVMADNLASDYEEELSRVRLTQELGEAAMDTLLPGYPYADRPVIAPTDEQRNGLPQDEEESTEETAVSWYTVSTDLIGAPLPARFGLGEGPFIGSNNWVVSGEHTDTGLPLLANDPHLGIQMPSIWYENSLHAPGWDVTGFSFVGVPGVIIGHNDKIAWGVTTSGPDVQDLYIEKINPSNPDQYEYEGEWQDMEIIDEVIKVNGGEDITLPVRLTRHGPIVTEVVTDEEDAVRDVLSVRWSAQEPSRILQSVVLLNTAQNYEEFFEAMRYWDVPSQNVVYADVEGNIAYIMPGRIPIRQNGDGTVPVPGWTGEYEWDGWIPHEALPSLFNPPEGFIVTANNAVVDPAYPELLNAYVGNDGDRAERITNLIGGIIADGGKITADDFARIQFDSKSLPAETYIPLFEGLSSDDPQVQAALERLRGWTDFQERRDSVPAALWEITYLQLVDNIFADDIGADRINDVVGNVLMYDMAAQPTAVWWDDSTTPARETQDDILLQSVADAVAWFETNVGGDMNEWTWGRIHTATFADSVLGASGIAPIEAIFNRGPFPADGGRAIVNATSWRSNDPADVTAVPSMRMIVDMSELDASRAIHPTGQSGHPYHPHYDDMIELWLNGAYHPMLWSRDAVEEAAVDQLLLQPADAGAQ